MRSGVRIPGPTLRRRTLLGAAVLLSARLATAFSHGDVELKWPAHAGASVNAAGLRGRVGNHPSGAGRGRAPVALPVAEAPASVDRPETGPVRTVEATRMLSVAHPAFDGQRAPSALVYVPAGIDRTRPLNVVVFIHGWNGCAASVAADVSTECHPDGTRRGALALVSQVRRSGVSAVLVVPQLALETRSSDPGHFRDPGYFRLFMEDVLAQMAPELGVHRVEDLGRVVLASHSGGYVTLLSVLSHGGVHVDEVALFDSLYDGVEQLVGWVAQDPARFDPSRPDHARLVTVFRGGSTQLASEDLGRNAARVFETAGHTGWVHTRLDVGRLTPDEAQGPVTLVRVPGNHREAGQWNLTAVLQGSGLPTVGSESASGDSSAVNWCR